MPQHSPMHEATLARLTTPVESTFDLTFIRDGLRRLGSTSRIKKFLKPTVQVQSASAAQADSRLLTRFIPTGMLQSS